MNPIRPIIVAAAFAAAVASALAQPGPGPGPGASAPRGGPGHMGGRAGMRYTPGWSMMTPQERSEHQAKMRSMTNADECKAYMEQHHQQMVARAKDKGLKMPEQPRRDACAGLKR